MIEGSGQTDRPGGIRMLDVVVIVIGGFLNCEGSPDEVYAYLKDSGLGDLCGLLVKKKAL